MVSGGGVFGFLAMIGNSFLGFAYFAKKRKSGQGWFWDSFLGSDGRPAVAALIHTSLWDEAPAVRVEAAMALWKIDRKLPLVLHVLVKALEDVNELICWIAAERLGQLGSAAREAVPALRQALERDFRVSLIKKAVFLALERIDPQARAEVG